MGLTGTSAKNARQRAAKQQNDHCFKSQTLAYQTMRFYNQCMGERGCEDEATCDSFFATGTASDGRSKKGIQFNYEVDPKISDSLCGNAWNGGEKCKDECCSTQWNYCSEKASIGEVHTLFDCMAERGCMAYATTKVNGKDGQQCNVGTLNFFIDPNWDDDNYKCGGTGNASCNDQCCGKNINHCTKGAAADTDPDACIVRCTKARKCNEEMSCSDYTFKVLPSDSSKCGDSGRGATRAKMIVAQAMEPLHGLWDYRRAHTVQVHERPRVHGLCHDQNQWEGWETVQRGKFELSCHPKSRGPIPVWRHTPRRRWLQK